MAKRFFAVRHFFAVCFTVADVKELLCRHLADGKDLADGKVADSTSVLNHNGGLNQYKLCVSCVVPLIA